MKKLTFLGTGSSVGVPMIGCSCAVCLSKDPFNQRLRSSVYLEWDKYQFLIDTGPDFREQALRYQITTLSGLLLTHAHHDHIAGFDDLRPICYYRKSPLPILLSKQTALELEKRYDYLFQSNDHDFSRFCFQILPSKSGQVLFENTSIEYVTYEQGGMQVNGYRIGSIAYLSDIRHYPPSIFKDLEGVQYLIISALRYTPSFLHFSIDEAIDFANELKAEKVWLTHLSHDVDYAQTNAYLPSHIRLAYDGLEIYF